MIAQVADNLRTKYMKMPHHDFNEIMIAMRGVHFLSIKILVNDFYTFSPTCTTYDVPDAIKYEMKSKIKTYAYVICLNRFCTLPTASTWK